MPREDWRDDEWRWERCGASMMAGLGGDGGLGKVARERHEGEDELAAALGNEAGEPRAGIGGTELDDMQVAVELLPGVTEDASACIGFVTRVFGMIGTCLALEDGTLGSFGNRKCGAAIVARQRARGRRGGIGRQETLGLVKTLAGRSEVLARVGCTNTNTYSAPIT